MDSDKVSNEALFDILHADRGAIETRFGGALDWQRLDDNKASRVAVFPTDDSIDDDEALELLRDWMAEQLAKLDRALGPTLDEQKL